MKRRMGFVSNSSSSSFIIMHHAEIKTVADAEELLPECIETFRFKHGYGISDKPVFEIVTRKQLAEWLFRDLKKISIEDMKKFHLNNGRRGESPEFYGKKEFTWEEFYSDTAYSNEILFGKEDNESKSEKSREETANYFHFYSVGYCDEGGGWGSFMEHEIAPMICLKMYSHH